ncbi:MAG: alpha/beta fold hydrolase [Holophagales bacterium]|nr:alpha/beta fold hydrolase [Holophagales bacterium]
MTREQPSSLRLLALHAFPLDGRMWGLVKAAAAAGQLGAGVAVTAPDFRGRGGSGRTAEPVHAMSLLARDVLEELPGDEPFVVMGLSMGGYVALELLARLDAGLRARLRGLVLCDSRANADDDAGKAKRADSAAAIEKDGMEPLLSKMLPQFLVPESRGGALEQLVRTMFLATPPATAAADQRGMAGRVDRFDVLGTLAVPFLAAVGDDDELTPPSASEQMVDAAVNAPWVELLTLPGAHLAPLEHPEEFLPKLRAFLDRCRG